MSTVILPDEGRRHIGQNTEMLKDVLSRIDRRLTKLGLAESRAATMAGLSDSAIRNMRRAVKAGKTQGASVKTITALAPVLRTSVPWLLEEQGPEEATSNLLPSQAISVPLISWISASELSHQEAVLDLRDYPTIPVADLPEGDYIALRVDGPSMNKISPPDSVILVNRRDRRLVANACYVIADETGAATYKRYRPNESPPFQPASYENIQAPKLEGAITVIGRVKRSMIDM